MPLCNNREDEIFMARTIIYIVMSLIIGWAPNLVFGESAPIMAVGPTKAPSEERTTEKTGQTNKDGTVPAQIMEKLSNAVTGDYIIGAEDVLDITVWRNADLSKTVQVRPDGRVSMPIIRDITAV